jgi:hypothetical protein
MKTPLSRMALLACAALLIGPLARAQDDLDEPFVDPLAGKLEPAPTPDVAAEPPADIPTFDTDKFQLTWGGRLQSDIRFRVEGKRVGDFYSRPEAPYGAYEAPTGVARNENILKLKLDAKYGRFAAKADVDFVYLGYPERVDGVVDLSERGKVEPFYLQAHAAYIEATDLFFDGLDLRIGQQLVQWGMADQFNPTNNLNANDLEDVLLFGEQQANLMAKLDYSPLGFMTLSAVLVPIFRPALTPRTAPLALAATDRMPMAEEWLRHQLIAENAMLTKGFRVFGLGELEYYPTIVDQVRVQLPDASFENMQAAGRIAFNTDWIDVALSYYYGRNDFPVATRNHTEQERYARDSRLCDPADPARCIDGRLRTVVDVVFPRQHVFGLNAAGELPLDWMVDQLGGIGWRLELGVYLPERIDQTITQGDIVMGGFPQPGGEYAYGLPDGQRPTVVDDQPFLKWTLGLDYSFGRWVYLNLMWVHGMPDEFGAGDFLFEGWTVRQSGVAAELDPDELSGCVIGERMGGQPAGTCGNRYAREIVRPRIGDYLGIVLDFKWLEDRGLFRLFFMWDLSGYYESYYDPAQSRRVLKYLSLFGDGFSAMLYPELTYNFGNGLELSAGALIMFGKDYTKFGDPASGGSMVFTRARYSW